MQACVIFCSTSSPVIWLLFPHAWAGGSKDMSKSVDRTHLLVQCLKNRIWLLLPWRINLRLLKCPFCRRYINIAAWWMEYCKILWIQRSWKWGEVWSKCWWLLGSLTLWLLSRSYFILFYFLFWRLKNSGVDFCKWGLVGYVVFFLIWS